VILCPAEKGVRISSHDNRIACDDGEDLYKCIYPHLSTHLYFILMLYDSLNSIAIALAYSRFDLIDALQLLVLTLATMQSLWKDGSKYGLPSRCTLYNLRSLLEIQREL